MQSVRIVVSVTLALLSFPALARTLWSGSFVPVSVSKNLVEVGLNYPAVGENKICGIELKSFTMILNKRVWQHLAEGLEVSFEFEDEERSLVADVTLGDGPRLSYALPEFNGTYAQIRIRCKDGQNLDQYFSTVLNGRGLDEPIIAVARECLSKT